MKNLYLFAASMFLFSTVVSNVYASEFESQDVNISIQGVFTLDLSDATVTGTAILTAGQYQATGVDGGTITITDTFAPTAYTVTAEASGLSGYTALPGGPGTLRVEVTGGAGQQAIIEDGVATAAKTVISSSGGDFSPANITYSFATPTTGTATDYEATVTFTVAASS